MKTPKCPRCETNEYMTSCDSAQKVGTPLGMAIGLGSRFLGGAIGGPAGALASLLAGAVAGQKLGELIDDHIIRQYRCTKCGCEVSL